MLKLFTKKLKYFELLSLYKNNKFILLDIYVKQEQIETKGQNNLKE